MGQDKALLEAGEAPLVVHALRLLRSLGLDPRICGSRPDLARFAPVVPDNFPKCGPLSGIEAALAATDSELNLFLPVDMPGVPREFLLWMIQRSASTAAVATIPGCGGLAEPLCAIYSRRLAAAIRTALECGKFKVMAALAWAANSLDERIDIFQVESVAAALAPGTWPSAPPEHLWFANLNTPADFDSHRAFFPLLEQTIAIQ